MLKLSPQQMRAFAFEGVEDLIDILNADYYIIERRGIRACYQTYDDMVNALFRLIDSTGMECTPFTPMICGDGEQRSVVLDFSDSCIVLILNPIIQLRILDAYDRAIMTLDAKVAQDSD